MTAELRLPTIGEEYMITRAQSGVDLDEPVRVEVELVTKRGRGYQVHTRYGRFRLKDFMKMAQRVDA